MMDDLLKAFDAAIADELPRVSTVEYNSHEICKHFADKVRTRIQQRLDTGGWMPIETAPINELDETETEIMVLTKQGTRHVVMYDSIFSAPWRIVNEFGFTTKSLQSWQPLPALPKEK